MRVGDRGEAVAVLAERYPRPVGLAGHPLMTVEQDLRAERREPGQLDRDMAPVRVLDVEGVMVDVLAPLLLVGDVTPR
jgi:hypothetical protein